MIDSRPIINASFSGGRTSGYMTKKLIDKYGATHRIIVTFANTGREDPRTLDFVHNCDRYFGFNTVWLEAVVHHGSRKAPTHRVVTYQTADRTGKVFEEVIKKYGIPNLAFPGCTRDLKLNPIRSYLASIGVVEAKVPTAMGIRADERRRVSPAAGARNIFYPLVDEWPTDKQDVLDWWEDQPFDLGIEEFEGNCKACFKKSYAKQFLQIDKDPTVYEWTRRMETLYTDVGPQQGKRVFFRGNLSTEQLFAMHEEQRGAPGRKVIDIYADGGCSESCEIYPTENVSDLV